MKWSAYLVSFALCPLAVYLLAAATLVPIAGAEDSDSVKAQFPSPPRQYSSGPLWVWNDLISEKQITDTLGDLAAQHVKQVWVHPRPGLMTPYLEKDWFRLWKLALKEAQRLDMNVWIYDENSYPSGFAGGLVPEAMPQSRGQGVHFAEVKTVEKPGDDVLAVYQMSDNAYKNITEELRSGKKFPRGRYLVASIRQAPASGWFGGKYYVDLLRPGVTEKFLEITMGAYEREIGQHFGGRVPGVFTDEPHLSPAGGLHWSVDFSQRFKQRWGYDLIDALPSLVRPLGDWRRVRHNYYRFCLEQFIEHWSKPFYEYCQKHNLEFTGHYWEHGWPNASHGSDNMAMYAWHQRPAIDNLMNQYSEGVHGQFGNTRTVRELATVANQLGRKRTLCEAYGAAGWELRFEDMKRIGDWLYVTGVNTLNEHLSYITIRGSRKRNHPQSFSYHAPWWDEYHVMADHFTRLSLVLSSGQQINRVLLLEPTTTAWMYQNTKTLGPLGNQFQDMINRLEQAQAEYDIGCEDIMGRHGSVKGKLLRVGQREYDLLILPPMTENLDEKTMRLVEQYTKAGGRVLACGPPPTRVDGSVCNRGKKAAAGDAWQQVSVAEAIEAATARTRADGLTINRAAADKGLLFHQRRRLDDGEFLFLVNTSIEHPSRGQIVSTARGIWLWDPDNGKISPHHFQADASGVKTDFDLPPCGSLLLFLSNKPVEPAVQKNPSVAAVAASGPVAVKRLQANVLTLDFLDVTAGGKTKKNAYAFAAGVFAFQQNGMSGNPWNSAVQLHDTLIKKKFLPGSGFEATYRFKLADNYFDATKPKPLHIVIERPDLYTISCNGRPLAAVEGRWWLDKSFGLVDITSIVVEGQNAVTIKASPMTVFHELEPAYLLGDFSLDSTDAGFVVASPRPIRLDAQYGWNQQGMPFYGHDVSYSQEFDIARPSGSYRVRLPSWYGSLAKVAVNGKHAGIIGYRPFQCDVTKFIRPGKNTVEVVVTGTLKNTLGPHHAGNQVGAAWPGNFQKSPPTGPPPGKDYQAIGYGLFEPFTLEQLRP